MKAVVFHEFGGADKLRVENIPNPTIADDEALINVKACALNHLDIWVREGAKRGISLPHVLGSDVAGVVAETGANVTHVKPGEEVLLSPNISCGKCATCLSGNDNLCSEYSILGAKEKGGYAEYVKVLAVNVIPKPRNLSFTEASAIPLVFLTAWHMLVTRARVQPGEKVLVVAAGSGVGSAAVQIAKLFRSHVIATVGSDAKAEKALALGADVVVDHSKNDIADEVRKLTKDGGVDIVVENVGQAVWSACIASLGVGGRMVFCGTTTGNKGEVDIRIAYMKHLSLLGSTMGTKGELLTLLRFVKDKRLKPVVDSVHPLEKAAAAQKLMEQHRHFGKIILEI